MKKNYITPKTQVIAVAASQMICTSGSNVTISNTTTTNQWSRGGDWDDDEGDE